MLSVGDRVRLTGSDAVGGWLQGRGAIEGIVERFIPGQHREGAAVVRLDETLRMSKGSGNIAILELRHLGTTWQDDVTVHVELCDFDPEDRPWAKRRQGEWVESGVTCHRLHDNDLTTGVESGATKQKSRRHPPDRYYPSPPVPGPAQHRRTRRYGLLILAVVVVALLVAYISLSDSVEYLHIGTNACLVTHTGWHFHIDCHSVSPPKP